MGLNSQLHFSMLFQAMNQPKANWHFLPLQHLQSMKVCLSMRFQAMH